MFKKKHKKHKSKKIKLIRLNILYTIFSILLIMFLATQVFFLVRYTLGYDIDTNKFLIYNLINKVEDDEIDTKKYIIEKEI